MHTVGIAGMGNMGRRVAARLAARGVDVAVWNRSPIDLPHPTCATPADLARSCSVVIVMVRDVEASRAVWLGADGIAAGAAETLAIEASTVTPVWTTTLAEHVPRFLGGPVVGTLPHAESGQLTVLFGGADADVAVASEVLAPLGKRVHVGPVGQAMAFKLAINAMFATEVAALTEAVALMSASGIPKDRALDLLGATPVFPGVLTGVAALWRAGDDAPRFPIALVEKDLGYAQEARPLFQAVRQRYAAAIAAGLGDLNIHGIHHLAVHP